MDYQGERGVTDGGAEGIWNPDLLTTSQALLLLILNGSDVKQMDNSPFYSFLQLFVLHNISQKQFHRSEKIINEASPTKCNKPFINGWLNHMFTAIMVAKKITFSAIAQTGGSSISMDYTAPCPP